VPSIAASGIAFYTADRFPAWKGNVFVGGMRTGEIPRTGGVERIVFNEKGEEMRRESLLTELRKRVRDVRQGPDGYLYVLAEDEMVANTGEGAVLRIEPVASGPAPSAQQGSAGAPAAVERRNPGSIAWRCLRRPWSSTRRRISGSRSSQWPRDSPTHGRSRSSPTAASS
jgi:hypothetical protein